MKNISFNHINLQPASDAFPVTPRNQREDLIEQIVAQCTLRPGEDRKLAKLIAVTANLGHWTAMDLHALLRKKEDPSIRNYTAFVWWSAKVRGTKSISD